MVVTDFSFMMAVIWSTVLLLAGAILTKSKKFVLRYGISGFLFIMVFGVIRLLLPVEFGFVRIVGDTVFIPAMQTALRVEIFHIFGKAITPAILLLAAWIAGSIIYLTVFFSKIARDNKIIKAIKSEYNPQFDSILKKLAEQAHSKQKYRLIVSESVSTPMMMGLFVPTILMPPITLTDREAEYVLKHEWSHFQHGDLWKKLLFNILCAFLWWNPFMYVIKKRLDYILEISCDHYVVKGQDNSDRIGYVETTLDVMRQISETGLKTSSSAVAFAEANSSSVIVRRCELILYPPQGSRANKRLLSMMLAVLLVFSYLFVIQPVSIAPPPEEGIDLIVMTPDNAYLIDNGNGTYDLYYEDVHFGIVMSSEMDVLPYSELPVKKR